MSDPTRLFDDPGASPALKELLGSARGDGPSAADLARLANKLGPLLVATAPATAAAAAAAGSSAAPAGAVATGAVATGAVATGTQVAAGVGAVKIAVLAAVGGTLIAGGAFQAGRSYEAAQQPPVRVEKVAAAPAPPEPVVEPEPAPFAEPPPVVAEPEPAKAVKATARVPAKVAPPPAPQTLSEVELLEQALAAMRAGDAREVLALTARHERQFAAGTLVQEREMLAIEALLKSGRATDARLKADAFRQRYPTSSHLLRLDALVPRSP